jgi:selenocysteine lyase/cysteine desulfurase
MNRRAFLAGAAALSAGCGASASRELTGFEAIRADFPRSSPENVYLNNASQHPISRSTARVIQEYADYLAGELTRRARKHRPKRSSTATPISRTARNCSAA